MPGPAGVAHQAQQGPHGTHGKHSQHQQNGEAPGENIMLLINAAEELHRSSSHGRDPGSAEPSTAATPAAPGVCSLATLPCCVLHVYCLRTHSCVSDTCPCTCSACCARCRHSTQM